MVFEEKTLESEILYSGRILTLRRDRVTTSAGASTREIVVHGGGIVIAAVLEDGRIPMVRQFRKAAEQTVLELPAGKLEAGEDPTEAALRELREETGYSAGRITELTAAYSSIGYSTELLRIYLAEDLTPGETDPDPGESLEVVLLPLEEIFGMAVRGELVDLKTIAAVLLVNERLQRGGGA
ncbi:MAG: NUDIX hydrolase [Clostridiales Family XIII bacterium]|jgi:ADP-ribose pyrophosphatase|nr:NUDIX hydrolase [Clostridiales Family XIII bacterium]